MSESASSSTPTPVVSSQTEAEIAKQAKQEMIEKNRALKQEKLLAASRKEGAKKGQDLSGLQELGGVRHFHVALETCKGNWDLVDAAMDGANADVDPSASERKGGAAGIAKVFMSASDERLCIYMHVPADAGKEVRLDEWFDVVVKAAGATVLLHPTPNGEFGFAKAEVLKVPEVFPLKKRDEAIGLGFAFLRSKNVIPVDESSEEFEDADELEW